MKCQGEGCRNKKAWAFRTTRDGNRLCDICWGFKFGEATCSICKRGCYEEEDFDDKIGAHICGDCRLEEARLDKAIEADMRHAVYGE